jgi:hypothetical protein
LLFLFNPELSPDSPSHGVGHDESLVWGQAGWAIEELAQSQEASFPAAVPAFD